MKQALSHNKRMHSNAAVEGRTVKTLANNSLHTSVLSPPKPTAQQRFKDKKQKMISGADILKTQKELRSPKQKQEQKLVLPVL